MILEYNPWLEMTCILAIVVIIMFITMVITFRKEDKENTELLKELNKIRFKFEIGQVVYIYKDNRIYKDKIKEIKINKKEITYTGIILKNIKEEYIYATFDDLCNDNKLNKDDILMYAYNNNLDKKEVRIEC